MLGTLSLTPHGRPLGDSRLPSRRLRIAMEVPYGPSCTLAGPSPPVPPLLRLAALHGHDVYTLLILCAACYSQVYGTVPPSVLRRQRRLPPNQSTP